MVVMMKIMTMVIEMMVMIRILTMVVVVNLFEKFLGCCIIFLLRILQCNAV